VNRSVVAVAVAITLVLSASLATAVFGLADGRGPGDCGRVPAGPVVATRVLQCIAPSLAFVETGLGTGSAILVEGGFLVTNAHVVEPFAHVDVVFEGGERHDDLPVVGADLVADIAVLGPVDTERRPLPIADFEGAKGDDLFLVGFPGEVDDEPEATISRGILSRTRSVEDFGLTFFQTDASIGGGQSGGALVDDRGRVVGVSGFSFAEQFALALSGGDTRSSIQRITGGDADGYVPFPDGPGATSGEFEVADPEAPQVLTVRTGDEPETIRLTLPAELDPTLMVVGWMGEVFFQNQAVLDLLEEVGEGSGGEADDPVSPGVFEFEVPEETYALIFVGSRRPGATKLRYVSSVPLGRYDDTDEGRRLRRGQRLEGVLDSLEVHGDSFVLDLDEGDEVEIHASSATGDVGFAVRAPGRRGDEEETFVDDSDEGLFGFDAKEKFTAKRSGAHRVTVYSADGRATAYALEVEPA